MTELVKQLSLKIPFYIRCIKPNSKKVPNEFDDKLVKHQVLFFFFTKNNLLLIKIFYKNIQIKLKNNF